MENQRVTFVNGEATITVPDSYFHPEGDHHHGNGLSPSALDMVILDNRGNEVQVPCDPFTIEIPQAQASEIEFRRQIITKPANQILTLSFKCSADSTIYLNGEKRYGKYFRRFSSPLSLPLKHG